MVSKLTDDGIRNPGRLAGRSLKPAHANGPAKLDVKAYAICTRPYGPQVGHLFHRRYPLLQQ